VVDGGEVHVVPGGWEKFVAWRAARREKAAIAAQGAGEAKVEVPRSPARANRKRSNRERQAIERHEQIEREIEALEAELAGLMEQVSAAGQAGDLARVEELSRAYQQRDAHLKDLWTEWERLGEQID